MHQHRAICFIVMFVVSISVVTSAPQQEKTLCIWATNCPSRTCADGLYCKDNGDWSQCLENPYTATPTCVATVNGEESDQIKWGCESDGDCCNPDAVCTAQKTCAIPCNLVPQEVSGRLWQQLGNDIDGEGRNDNAGINTLSGNGKVVAVASRSAKQVRVFQLDDSNSWEQIGSDIDSALEDFGHTLALSNDGAVLAIGAPGANPRLLPYTPTVAGTVQVFKDDGGVWKQLGQDLTGTSIGDYFGGVVSLSGNGDTLAVGAQYFGSTDRGAVKVFALNGNTWEVIGLIKGENGDRFGDKLELSNNGKVLVVGNPNHVDSGLDLGLARAYKYDARAKMWPQLGQDIVGEDTADRAGYGVSVSGDGKIMAVGAYNHDGGRGHVRIFAINGKKWKQIGDIDGEGPGHLFGVSVDLSFDGKVVAIGADYAENSEQDYYFNQGSARVFRYTKNFEWKPLGQELEGEAKQDYFGFTVSISNDGMVLSVGSSYADSNGQKDAGLVKVYSFEQETACAPQWKQTAMYYKGWNVVYKSEMYVAQRDTVKKRNPKPTNKRGRIFFRKVAKAWVATRSYTKGALVLQNGRELYKSIVSNNKNNNPETEEASWELLSVDVKKGCK